jgi:hypothetical protein
MKRYRIYLIVILFVLSGAHHKIFSQNSDIEIIFLQKPSQTTVYDPAKKDIQVQIKMNNLADWGTIPPSGIGFISLVDNLSWIPSNVEYSGNGVEPFYVCKYFAPEYFTKDTNIIYLWLHDEANSIDTVASFTIIYDKPQVELLTVMDSDSLPASRDYVVYESNPQFVVQANSLFTAPAEDSFITKIILTDNATTLDTTIWEDLNGVSEVNITRALPHIFSLEPGKPKTFTLVTIGKSNLSYIGPVETSTEFSFTLTYLSLTGPSVICKVDDEIALTGLPEGGIFSGNGIISGTRWFNPSLANIGLNTVTYFYKIEGTEFSTTKTIQVIDKPVLTLDGSRQVCRNSTDVLYRITNPDANYNYLWTFDGISEIIYSNNYDTSIVHWNTTQNEGTISIKLEPKTTTQACPATFEYIIDIDPDAAPDKPCICFGDKSKRLLLSSVTDAAYYEWYLNGEELLGSSNTPYFYLTEEIYEDFQINDLSVFTVRIAFQETGCYTTGFMCADVMCAGNDEFSFLNPSASSDEDLVISIQSNPVTDNMNITTKGNYLGRLELQLYDMTGSLVWSKQLNRETTHEYFQSKLQVSLDPAIYILTCLYAGKRTLPVKMIVY